MEIVIWLTCEHCYEVRLQKDVIIIFYYLSFMNAIIIVQLMDVSLQ